METQQHTCQASGSNRSPVQCSCGQWWNKGIAIAGFVAKRVLEETPAEPEMELVVDLGVSGDDIYMHQLREYGKQYNKNYQIECTMRFVYWEFGHKGLGVCGKSYLAVGPATEPRAGVISYGVGSMMPSQGGGTMFRPKPYQPSNAFWKDIIFKRLDHQYKLIAEVLV